MRQDGSIKVLNTKDREGKLTAKQTKRKWTQSNTFVRPRNSAKASNALVLGMNSVLADNVDERFIFTFMAN